jgi:hypothetical protein
MYRISLFIYIARALEVSCTLSSLFFSEGGAGIDPDMYFTASRVRNKKSLRTVMIEQCLIVPTHQHCP